MPRPRLVQVKAETSGATYKNPGRFEGRKTAKQRRPLGSAYVRMTDGEKEAWGELQSEMPWLTSAHRPLVRMACVWIAKMDEGDFGIGISNALSSILSKLGATPVDETKVNHGDEEDEEPGDKFFK